MVSTWGYPKCSINVDVDGELLFFVRGAVVGLTCICLSFLGGCLLCFDVPKHAP